MVNYTWKIEQLDVLETEGELDNVVCKVHWRLFAEEGGISVDSYGEVILGSPDLDNFTSFEDLTEEEVVQWLENWVSGEDYSDANSLKALLSNQIQGKKINPPPPVPLPLPWQ